MTLGWAIFAFVMPATVVGIGWLAVLANERHLRNLSRSESSK